jgi:methyl-accepting chemotaxis protein
MQVVLEQATRTSMDASDSQSIVNQVVERLNEITERINHVADAVSRTERAKPGNHRRSHA